MTKSLNAALKDLLEVDEMKIVNILVLMIVLCTPVFGQETVDELNSKGVDLAEQGRYEEAVAVFDKAIEIDPEYAYAWSNKGNVLSDMGKYDEAIAAFDRAIEIDPEYAVAWYKKAEALRMLHRDTESKEAYAKARELGYSGAMTEMEMTV